MKRYIIFFLYLTAWATLTYFSVEPGTVRGLDMDSIRNLVAALDVGSAVALASLAAYAYFQARQDEDWIDVVFVDDEGRKLDQIDKALQREDLTRGEVSGILRSYHGPGSFKVAYLNTDAYRAHLRSIKDGSSRQLQIKVHTGDVLGDLRSHPEPPPIWPGTDEVFLNLSNHASTTWSSEQLEAARALAPEAKLVDIAFTQVNPSYSTPEVMTLAESCWNELKSTLIDASQRPVGAMVAGEPTLCLALVQRLQRAGVTCYCATTRRESQVSAEGIKTSQFTFVRFRRWPEV